MYSSQSKISTFSSQQQPFAIVIAVLTIVFMTIGTNGSLAFGIKEWSGGDRNDPNWTSNGNWAGIGGAGRNDTLVFPAGADRLNPLNDFPINTSFGKLDFRGRGYVISGNQIFLENGVLINIPGGVGNSTEFNPNIILGDFQTWRSTQGFVRFNGVLNLNSNHLTVDTSLGASIVLNGLVNGTGQINKDGTGTLVVSGDADGFGPIAIFDGSVNVLGSIGQVVFQTGVLRGTGTTGSISMGCTFCSGTIAPGTAGNTAGTLTTNGFVFLNPASTIAIDLNSAQSDQYRVNGNNLLLAGANLTLSLNFTPTVGQQFTIISQTGLGDIQGQFAQGTAIVINSQLFKITYSPSSVVLTAQGLVNP